MLFRSSSASIGLKTSSLIGRVARYTPSSTYVLSLDSLPNLFDKPNEQSQACLDSAMARKGGRKPTFSISQMSRAKLAWTLPWREKVGASQYAST